MPDHRLVWHGLYLVAFVTIVPALVLVAGIAGQVALLIAAGYIYGVAGCFWMADRWGAPAVPTLQIVHLRSLLYLSGICVLLILAVSVWRALA